MPSLQLRDFQPHSVRDLFLFTFIPTEVLHHASLFDGSRAILIFDPTLCLIERFGQNPDLLTSLRYQEKLSLP
jgi:hypothetical protein